MHVPLPPPPNLGPDEPVPIVETAAQDVAQRFQGTSAEEIARRATRYVYQHEEDLHEVDESVNRARESRRQLEEATAEAASEAAQPVADERRKTRRPSRARHR